MKLALFALLVVGAAASPLALVDELMSADDDFSLLLGGDMSDLEDLSNGTTVACDGINFAKCAETMTKAVGYAPSDYPTIGGFATALKAFAAKDPANLQNICDLTANLTNCVGNAAQQKACFSTDSIRKNLYRGNTAFEGNATAFHYILYMLPAECSKAAAGPFAVIKNNYKCVSAVSYATEQSCVTKKVSGSFCDQMNKRNVQCFPLLYSHCGKGVEKAVCQLLYHQMSAIPELTTSYAKCNITDCDIYNAAPTTAVSVLGLVLAAIVALRGLTAKMKSIKMLFFISIKNGQIQCDGVIFNYDFVI